jgi:hypothetical protein
MVADDQDNPLERSGRALEEQLRGDMRIHKIERQ